MRLEELVNIHWDSLNESDLYIWNYIYKHKNECVNLSIEELGNRCNVSRMTILRFAKKLGLTGYSEFKFYLKAEKDTSLSRSDALIDLDVVQNNYIQMFRELKDKDFTKYCELINQAGRIFVYGTGMLQRTVAKEMARMFASQQKYMIQIEGEAECRQMLEAVTATDLVIVISITGDTEKTRNLARNLNIKNIPFISITELSNNTLAQLATERLYVTPKSIHYEENRKYHSTAMFFVLVEYLFVKYVNYKQTQLFQP